MARHIGKHARIEAKPKNSLAEAVKKTSPTYRLLGAVALSPILFLALPQAQAAVIPDQKAMVVPEEVPAAADYTSQKDIVIGNTSKAEGGNAFTSEASVTDFTAKEAPKAKPAKKTEKKTEDKKSDKADKKPATAPSSDKDDDKGDDSSTISESRVEAQPAENNSPSNKKGSSTSVQSDSNGSSYSDDSSSLSERIIEEAKKHLGTPYLWGGTTPAGFDCSGYTQYVYAKNGVSLPRTSSAQMASGRMVSQSEAKVGDLVWMPGHIGIYAGDGKMYHSPRTGDVVKLSKIWTSSYKVIRVF